MPDLTFEAAGHVYRYDGRIVPSVTQILEVVDECWRVPVDVLERAGRLGTAVHLACELDDLDDLDETSVDPVIAPYLAAWRRFRSETGFAPDLIEHRVHHRSMGYAGTLDRVGTLFERRSLIDIKSGEEWPSHGPQTAAYKEALATEGEKVSDRYAVYLRDDGTYRLRKCEDKSDWAVFLACLTIRKYKER